MAAYIKTLYFSQPDFDKPPLADPSGAAAYTIAAGNPHELVLKHASDGPCIFCVSLHKGQDGKRRVRFSLYDSSYILAEREEALLFDVVVALAGDKAAMTGYLSTRVGHWLKTPQPEFLNLVAQGLRVGLGHMIEAMKTQQAKARQAKGPPAAEREREREIA